MKRATRIAALALMALPMLLGNCASGRAQSACAGCSSKKPRPDVPYEPSDPKVVSEMIRLANVGPDDVVYDLGCGDGRIVIAAVKERGARGVCIDIDPTRIRESQENARRAGVLSRITFRTQDLFQAEIADASVVMLFLWPEVNLRLKPKLLRELTPGTRVVSHMHDMGSWKPDSATGVDVRGRTHEVFLWHIPPR